MQKETELVCKGKDPAKHSGMVNVPIYQTSTVVFPTLASYLEAEKGQAYYPATEEAQSADFSYGTGGTPTHFALQEALASLEGGVDCVLTGSGLSAITLVLLALLKPGDHILVVDTVYGPTRRFCNKELKRLGVETTYYDPLIGGDIALLLKENTRLVFLESPGSLTFEVQDVPAILAAVKAHQERSGEAIYTILDNSWATPLYYRPLAQGVDVVIQAVTKYLSGHSDVLMGAVIAREEKVAKRLRAYQRNSGQVANPHGCYLALRGVRSLAARMARHQQSAMVIATWLESHPKVKQVLFPALASHPQHGLWKEQFDGAPSLFTVVLDQHYTLEQLAKMTDQMQYFGIGASWGGYESLMLPIDPAQVRSAVPWKAEGSCIRLHLGLEAVEDVQQDLAAGLDRL